jgi:hypothetical protein
LAAVEGLDQALSDEKWIVRLSDKGAYTRASVELLGGVESVAGALRDAATRTLFDAYLAGRDSDVSGLFLLDTQRRYLSFEDIRGLVGDGADVVVNDLYNRGALVRGHVLKCTECRATSFYTLSDRQHFVCRRCRLDQRASRTNWLGEPEPPFRYELAEVLYQLLKNDGDLPLLAAYDYFVSMLGARDRRPLDLGFEIEMLDATGDQGEHDIVAIWGGDLWIGEATTTATLGSKQLPRLRRLRRAAEALSARGVLFASAKTFTDRTRENVATVFHDCPQVEIGFVEEVPRQAVRE